MAESKAGSLVNMQPRRECSTLPANAAFLSVTTSTVFPYEPEQLALLPSDSHYCLIPGLPSLFLCSEQEADYSLGWQHLSQFLAYINKAGMTRKVFDLTTSLRLEDKNYPVRAIIYGGKLVGLRPALVIVGSGWSAWQRFVFKQIRLPSSIRALTGQSTCPVGQFYISFSNSKCAPIFGQELRSYPQFLKIYQVFGVQIYSVSDFTAVTAEYRETYTSLINFSSTGYCVIYGNPLGALSLDCVYGGGNFIACSAKIVAQVHRFSSRLSRISACVQLDQIKAKKLSNLQSNKGLYLLAAKCPKSILVPEHLFLPKKSFDLHYRQSFIPDFAKEDQYAAYKQFLLDFYRRFNTSFLVIFELNMRFFAFIAVAKQLALELQHLLSTDSTSEQKSTVQILFSRKKTWNKILSQLISIVELEPVPAEIKSMAVYCQITAALEGSYLSFTEKAASERFKGLPYSISALSRAVAMKPNKNIFFVYSSSKTQPLAKLYQQFSCPGNNFGTLHPLKQYQVDLKSFFSREQVDIILRLARDHSSNCKQVIQLNEQIRKAEKVLSAGKGLTGVIRRSRLDADKLVKGVYDQLKLNGFKKASFAEPQSTHIAFCAYLQRETARLARGLSKTEEDQTAQWLSNQRINESIAQIQNMRKILSVRCHRCRMNFENRNGERCACRQFFCHVCLTTHYKLTVKSIEDIQGGPGNCPVCLRICKFKCCKGSSGQPLTLFVCHLCGSDQFKFKIRCCNRKCKLIFCKRCIQMELNQNVLLAKLAPGWSCFVCVGKCTCLNCQKQKNRSVPDRFLSQKKAYQKLLMKKRQQKDDIALQNFFKTKQARSPVQKIQPGVQIDSIIPEINETLEPKIVFNFNICNIQARSTQQSQNPAAQQAVALNQPSKTTIVKQNPFSSLSKSFGSKQKQAGSQQVKSSNPWGASSWDKQKKDQSTNNGWGNKSFDNKFSDKNAWGDSKGNQGDGKAWGQSKFKGHQGQSKAWGQTKIKDGKAWGQSKFKKDWGDNSQQNDNKHYGYRSNDRPSEGGWNKGWGNDNQQQKQPKRWGGDFGSKGNGQLNKGFGRISKEDGRNEHQSGNKGQNQWNKGFGSSREYEKTDRQGGSKGNGQWNKGFGRSSREDGRNYRQGGQRFKNPDWEDKDRGFKRKPWHDDKEEGRKGGDSFQSRDKRDQKWAQNGQKWGSSWGRRDQRNDDRYQGVKEQGRFKRDREDRNGSQERKFERGSGFRGRGDRGRGDRGRGRGRGYGFRGGQFGEGRRDDFKEGEDQVKKYLKCNEGQRHEQRPAVSRQQIDY